MAGRYVVMSAARVWAEGVRRRLPIMFLRIVMIVSMAGAFASQRAAFTARPMATLALSGRARGSELGTTMSWGLGGL
jgi:hypothetical protein